MENSEHSALEILISEAADEAEAIIYASTAKFKDLSEEEKTKRCSLTSNKRKFASGFAKIPRDKRKQVVDLFYSVIRLSDRKTPDFDVDVFRVGYFKAYQDVSEIPEKRELLNEGLARLIEISKTARPIRASFAGKQGLWKGLLATSPETISLWIDSLKHLEEETPERDEEDKGVEKYVVTSVKKMMKYHPSYNHVMGILAAGRGLYGLEDFMFDLAAERGLDARATAEYFGNLRVLPEEARLQIEKIRGVLKSEENPADDDDDLNSASRKIVSSRKKTHEEQGITYLDQPLYHLFTSPAHRGDSQKVIAFMLDSLWKKIDEKPKQQIIESIPVLSEILEADVGLITEEIIENSIGIITDGRSSHRLLLRPYLEVVRQISRLHAPMTEKKSYVDFATQMFRDYFKDKARDSEANVRMKCLKSIDAIHGLRPEYKETALNLLNSCRTQIRQYTRLREQGNRPLYLDIAAESICSSVLQDQSKADDFIEAVIDYRRAR